MGKCGGVWEGIISHLGITKSYLPLCIVADTTLYCPGDEHDQSNHCSYWPDTQQAIKPTISVLSDETPQVSGNFEGLWTVRMPTLSTGNVEGWWSAIVRLPIILICFFLNKPWK